MYQSSLFSAFAGEL